MPWFVRVYFVREETTDEEKDLMYKAIFVVGFYVSFMAWIKQLIYSRIGEGIGQEMRYDFFYNYISSLERQKALNKLRSTVKSTEDEGTK